MLPACTTTVEAFAVGASDLTSGSKSLTSDSPSLEASPASCLLTLSPPPILRSLAEKFGEPAAAAVGAELSSAAADVRPLQKGVADASVAAAFSSSSALGVEAGRINGASSVETAAVVESVSQADEAAYEEVRLQELEFDALEQHFVYPCPCGDLFELSVVELRAAVASSGTHGFALASCPSCSLKIRVLFENAELKVLEEELSISVLPDEA
ncbi:hypothetical protein Esti_005763 [Eimeria stiedai]